MDPSAWESLEAIRQVAQAAADATAAMRTCGAALTVWGPIPDPEVYPETPWKEEEPQVEPWDAWDPDLDPLRVGYNLRSLRKIVWGGRAPVTRPKGRTYGADRRVRRPP